MSRTPTLSRPRQRLASVLAVLALAALPGLAGAQTSTADPFKDPRYMSGLRDVMPPEVPEELKGTDALTRIQALKRITACADPFAFPSTEVTDAPRGYDVDLLREIANTSGWQTYFIWVNTAGRGGLNRAFRTSIRKGMCDVFLGLGTGAREDVLAKSKLETLAPAFGVAYVLVALDPALAGKGYGDLAQAGTKVATAYFTPAENILDQKGVPHESFQQSRRALEALARDEVKAAFVPSTSLAELRRLAPERKVIVLDIYRPADAFAWNSTWAVAGNEAKLKDFLEQSIVAIGADGRMARILDTYGIPYLPPF